MSRHIEKVKPVDEKYNAMMAGINPRTATAMATIKHRERGRIGRRLNAAKFESRRSGDSTAYIQAGVDEMIRILGV